MAEVEYATDFEASELGNSQTRGHRRGRYNIRSGISRLRTDKPLTIIVYSSLLLVVGTWMTNKYVGLHIKLQIKIQNYAGRNRFTSTNITAESDKYIHEDFFDDILLKKEDTYEPFNFENWNQIDEKIRKLYQTVIAEQRSLSDAIFNGTNLAPSDELDDDVTLLEAILEARRRKAQLLDDISINILENGKHSLNRENNMTSNKTEHQSHAGDNETILHYGDLQFGNIENSTLLWNKTEESTTIPSEKNLDKWKTESKGAFYLSAIGAVIFTASFYGLVGPVSGVSELILIAAVLYLLTAVLWLCLLPVNLGVVELEGTWGQFVNILSFIGGTFFKIILAVVFFCTSSVFYGFFKLHTFPELSNVNVDY